MIIELVVLKNVMYDLSLFLLFLGKSLALLDLGQVMLPYILVVDRSSRETLKIGPCLRRCN